MKVTGIGGVFFRAKDPTALSAWYEKHLGINGMMWAQEQAGVGRFASIEDLEGNRIELWQPQAEQTPEDE